MARETDTWKWLAKARRTMVTLHINRIENAAGPGMPDVEGCVFTRQFWFELKQCARPARELTPCRFKVRPKQVAWNNRRWIAGGNNFYLIQVGSGHDRRIYMLPGNMGKTIAAGMPECDIAMAAINDSMLTAEDFIMLATSTR